MIRYLYATELAAFPTLTDTMFRDRATQFRDRLKWDVSVDEKGWETDQYDAMNPLYLIWEKSDGTHGGSMRFLPTTGDNMTADVFNHLTDGVTIRSPLIWECTRFCLAPDATPNTAAALMLGAAELGIGMNLSHSVGVFDARMPRIYKRLGWAPDVLGTQDGISTGLWAFQPDMREKMAAKAEISTVLSGQWFQNAFGPLPMMTG